MLDVHFWLIYGLMRNNFEIAACWLELHGLVVYFICNFALDEWLLWPCKSGIWFSVRESSKLRKYFSFSCTHLDRRLFHMDTWNADFVKLSGDERSFLICSFLIILLYFSIWFICFGVFIFLYFISYFISVWHSMYIYRFYQPTFLT